MTRQVLHAIVLQVNHQRSTLDIFDKIWGRIIVYTQKKTPLLLTHTHAGDLISYGPLQKNKRTYLVYGEKIAQPHQWIREDLHFFSVLMHILRTTTYKSNPDQPLFTFLRILYTRVPEKVGPAPFKFLVLCKLLSIIGINPHPENNIEKKLFAHICQPMETILNTMPNTKILKVWTEKCLDTYYTNTQSQPIKPFDTIPGTQ